MFVPGAWFELRCLLHYIIVARLTRHFVRAEITGVIVAICKLGIVMFIAFDGCAFEVFVHSCYKHTFNIPITI